MAKQKVVYLFGAGATQAAISKVDDTCNVLMPDISQAVLLKIRQKEIKDLYPISNELSEETNMDVEHLITVLDSSPYPYHLSMAEHLRQLFRGEILERLRRVPSQIKPNLYAVLFDLYKTSGFAEELIGAITLNYDQIAEIGFASVYGGVNYVINAASKHSVLRGKKRVPPFIKIHGSFNWQNKYPVTMADEDRIKQEEALWIPPGMGKRAEYYPFDLLWGRAYEILNCDILRIVGCSLSANDMHLVSMIFRTQKLLEGDQNYRIELIDYPDSCRDIAERYRYLYMSEIMDQSNFVAAIASELFPNAQDQAHISEKQRREIHQYLQSGRVNIFDRWIRMKAENLYLETGDVDTKSGILAKYLEEVAQ